MRDSKNDDIGVLSKTDLEKGSDLLKPDKEQITCMFNVFIFLHQVVQNVGKNYLQINLLRYVYSIYINRILNNVNYIYLNVSYNYRHLERKGEEKKKVLVINFPSLTLFSPQCYALTTGRKNVYLIQNHHFKFFPICETG